MWDPDAALRLVFTKALSGMFMLCYRRSATKEISYAYKASYEYINKINIIYYIYVHVLISISSFGSWQ